MKLTEGVFDRAEYAQKRYVTLKELFKSFLDGATYLAEPETPIKGVKFEPSLDENYFDVFFVGMKFRFRFFVYYDTDDKFTGKVVALREMPSFSITPEVIGSFSFNTQGMTDFEVKEGNDKLEIGYNAASIILHFLDQALGKPLH